MLFPRTAAALAEFAWAPWRSDERRILYHYTTAHGLHGIVTQGKLRLTHTRHLNDETEGLHGARAVDLALDEMKLRCPGSDLIKALSVGMKFALRQNQAPDTGGTFVGCFSTLGDSLPQWRGYGQQDSSFAMAIDADRLFKLASKAWGGRCWLLPVEYDQDRFVNNFIHVLDIASNEFEQYNSTHDPQLLIKSLVLQVANYGSALKHFAFKEEEEWRLILLSLPEDRELAVHHLSNSTFRPYVELELTPDFLSEALLEVIVGPQNYQEATLHGVASFLRQRTGRSISVVKSKVPYKSRT